ncbi:MAG: hypothetical protein JO002_02785, partial [Burkholderiaceae bacterium]|nr:hypothetical protein [Burkholderiaceae bacterium]
MLYGVLTLQMWVLGAGILSKMSCWHSMPNGYGNGWLRASLAMSLGFGLDAVWLFLLGVLGALTLPWVCGGLLLATLFAGKALRWAHPRLSASQAWLLLAAILLFVGIGVNALRSPGFWDDTMYHLPLARAYLQAHGLVLVPFLRFPLFPQYMDLMLTLGLMLGGAGGDFLAQGLATLPLFIVSLGLVGVAAAITSAYWPGFAAVVLLFTLGPIRDALGYAYVDNGLLLFCWSALVALTLSIDAGRASKSALSWAALAGFFAGVAAGTKYFGVPLAGLAGLWFFLLTRHWRATLVYG